MESSLSQGSSDPLKFNHKPSQCEQIVEAFKRHGWKVTLGDLLSEGQFTFAHKLTARLSDLRKQGYSIKCELGPNPSKNTYFMTPPQNGTYMCHFDESGQMEFC